MVTIATGFHSNKAHLVKHVHHYLYNLSFQIFDILPLYGTLKPGDTEQITLTFYGHADIGSRAKAICEVEGGPTYEVVLKGEASLVNYGFDCVDLDYSKIVSFVIS